MKLVAILLLLLGGISSASGQGNAVKNVGVIFVLSDSIYQNHLGFTIFENFNKAYPQHDSINVIKYVFWGEGFNLIAFAIGEKF